MRAVAQFIFWVQLLVLEGLDATVLKRTPFGTRRSPTRDESFPVVPVHGPATVAAPTALLWGEASAPESDEADSEAEADAVDGVLLEAPTPPEVAAIASRWRHDAAAAEAQAQQRLHHDHDHDTTTVTASGGVESVRREVLANVSAAADVALPASSGSSAYLDLDKLAPRSSASPESPPSPIASASLATPRSSAFVEIPSASWGASVSVETLSPRSSASLATSSASFSSAGTLAMPLAPLPALPQLVQLPGAVVEARSPLAQSSGIVKAVEGLPRLALPHATWNHTVVLAESVLSILIWAAVVLVVASFYYKEKQHPPKDKAAPAPRCDLAPLRTGEWRFGLFDCLEEPALCLFSCCCTPVRWADTMRMACLLSFSGALLLFVGLIVLDTVCVGVSIFVLLGFLVYFRQRVRKLFGIPSGDFMTVGQDCMTYLFCCWCAVAQEARQLEEAYQVRHPEVCPPRQ